MRAMYVIVGLLLGVIFTSRFANWVISTKETDMKVSITAAALTGYNEGWKQGKNHTEARLFYSLTGCYEMVDKLQELNQLYRKGRRP